MIRNECEIVRDVIPNYIEKQINNGTKEFIEEHLKSCKECNEILNSLLHEKDIKTEEKEIDFLKKYNRKLNILKIIAVILAMIILIIWAVVGMNYIQKKIKYEEDYEKGKYIYDIINEAYNNIEKIKDGKNYKLSDEYKRTDYVTKEEYVMTTLTIRKEEYFREEKDLGRGKSIEYGIYFGDREIAVHFNSELSYSGYSIAFKPVTADNAYEIGGIHKSIIECSKFEVKEENKYYIIKRYIGEETTEEVWINKEDMTVHKTIYDTKGTAKVEHTYTWEVNNVKYEDIEVKGGYEKVQELLKEVTME